MGAKKIICNFRQTKNRRGQHPQKKIINKKRNTKYKRKHLKIRVNKDMKKLAKPQKDD